MDNLVNLFSKLTITNADNDVIVLGNLFNKLSLDCGGDDNELGNLINDMANLKITGENVEITMNDGKKYNLHVPCWIEGKNVDEPIYFISCF